MFSLPDLEAATGVVHESFPGTPQYPWPLLAERSGADVWVLAWSDPEPGISGRERSAASSKSPSTGAA